jgi:GNAT superfamily N-acetyltransferase
MLVFSNELKRKHKTKLFELFCDFKTSICENYVINLFNNRYKYKIVLYSIDNPFSIIENCPCGLIYKVHKSKGKVYICIMFIATKFRFRKYGYATIFIQEFIENIRNKYNCNDVVIILDSLDPAVTFYEKIGFKWIITEETHCSMFNIEKEDKNNHFIMVYYF